MKAHSSYLEPYQLECACMDSFVDLSAYNVGYDRKDWSIFLYPNVSHCIKDMLTEYLDHDG